MSPIRIERATLTIRGANGFGLLRLELFGQEIKIEMEARHCKILRAYALARKEDLARGVDEVFQGMRSNVEIGSMYAGQDDHEFPYTPGLEAIKAYRSQIQNRINKASPKGFDPPRLFESRRYAGTRLAVNIEVIDLAEKGSAE